METQIRKGPRPYSAAPGTTIECIEHTSSETVVQPRARGILFTGEMVRGIRARQKTQTRRLVTVQPPPECTVATFVAESTDSRTEHTFAWLDRLPCPTRAHHVRCRYGLPGDLLWVKETWSQIHDGTLVYRADLSDQEASEARAVQRGCRLSDHERWRSSLLMPRWASRLLLRVDSVRGERLQAISSEDAVEEGFDSRSEFLRYWDELGRRKPGALARDNPWVFAIRFELVADRSFGEAS